MSPPLSEVLPLSLCIFIDDLLGPPESHGRLVSLAEYTGPCRISVSNTNGTERIELRSKSPPPVLYLHLYFFSFVLWTLIAEPLSSGVDMSPLLCFPSS